MSRALSLPRFKLPSPRRDWRLGAWHPRTWLPAGRALAKGRIRAQFQARIGARFQAATRPKTLNLALQGGGAHGAFTWGVLDRLLEDGRIEVGSVSGTSAGAMNAVVLAHGLMEGGGPYARERMGEFWRAVSEIATYSPLRAHPLDPRPADEGHVSSTRMVMFDLMTRLVSPYQFNPLDFNPLRDVLEQSIDFKRLRDECPIELHIAATDVATGKPKIFGTAELTADCLLASACLPQLHKAVKIGRRHYWDGGYSANPAILPLVDTGAAEDTLIVQLDPAVVAQVPTDAPAIISRVSRLTFGAPLQREIEAIERLRDLAVQGWTLDLGSGGDRRRRIRAHRFHHIGAGRRVRHMGADSRMTPNWPMLCRLRDLGRNAAETWLRQNFDALGRRSSVDLTAEFL